MNLFLGGLDMPKLEKEFHGAQDIDASVEAAQTAVDAAERNLEGLGEVMDAGAWRCLMMSLQMARVDLAVAESIKRKAVDGEVPRDAGRVVFSAVPGGVKFRPLAPRRLPRRPAWTSWWQAIREWVTDAGPLDLRSAGPPDAIEREEDEEQ